MSDLYEIYTDGGCWPNPGGVGGWAYVVLRNRVLVCQGSGRSEDTTNNRMELLAATEALGILPEGTAVKVYSDAEYLVKGMKDWIWRWLEKGWPKKIKNRIMWERLLELERKRIVEWQWVRGHSGDYWNEYCDRMASQAANQP